jgi:hypothetical protein
MIRIHADVRRSLLIPTLRFREHVCLILRMWLAWPHGIFPSPPPPLCLSSRQLPTTDPAHRYCHSQQASPYATKLNGEALNLIEFSNPKPEVTTFKCMYQNCSYTSIQDQSGRHLPQPLHWYRRQCFRLCTHVSSSQISFLGSRDPFIVATASGHALWAVAKLSALLYRLLPSLSFTVF